MLTFIQKVINTDIWEAIICDEIMKQYIDVVVDLSESNLLMLSCKCVLDDWNDAKDCLKNVKSTWGVEIYIWKRQPYFKEH